MLMLQVFRAQSPCCCIHRHGRCTPYSCELSTYCDITLSTNWYSFSAISVFQQ